MPSINIFDPGLLAYPGHHADIDFRLARQFQSLGFDVKVFAGIYFESSETDLDVRSVFTVSPYWAVSRYHLPSGVDGLPSIFSASREDVVRVIRQSPVADLSLFPTLFPCQADALVSLMPHLRKVAAVIHTPPNWRNPESPGYWRVALKGLAAHGNILKLGVLEQELLLEYERLLEDRASVISQFPIPHDGFHKVVSVTTPPTIGVLGHQRGEKGLGRLNELVIALRGQGFRVVLHDSSGSVKPVKVDEDLLVFGYQKDFQAVLRNCDVVVLDYDVDAYRFNGSGVAWECLASGIPLVAPLGTSISRLLRHYSCGATFVSSNLVSLIESVKQVTTDYDSFFVEAQRAREEYLRVNGAANLLRALVF